MSLRLFINNGRTAWMCDLTPQAPPLLFKPCFSDMAGLPSANRRYDTLQYWLVITAEIQRHI